MNLFEIQNKINLFNSLIDGQCTGTPTEFAQKLGVSRSELYITINHAQALGLTICYSRTRCTFYYDSPARIILVIEPCTSITNISATTLIDYAEVAGDRVGGNILINSMLYQYIVKVA